MASDEDEEREVMAGTKGVGKEDQDEEPADDLEENAEEEDDPVEQCGEVFVQRPPLESGVVGGEAPGQAGEEVKMMDDILRYPRMEVMMEIVWSACRMGRSPSLHTVNRVISILL